MWRMEEEGEEWKNKWNFGSIWGNGRNCIGYRDNGLGIKKGLRGRRWDEGKLVSEWF